MTETHEQLVALVEDLQSGPDWLAAMATAARFHRYSFGNALLIMASHARAYAAGRVPDPAPDVVAGYHTWRALGRHVVAGQRGHSILCPVMRHARIATAPDGATRRLERGQQPDPGERVSSQQVLVGWSIGTVFSRSQTDGADLALPPEPVLLTGQAPPGLWDALTTLLSQTGYAVHDDPNAVSLAGANGLTDFTAHTVAVRTDMDPAARVKTLLHETGHALLHAPAPPAAPAAASGSVGPIRVCRGVAEVEAESVAFVVAAAHGMDTSAFTLPYVASWAGDTDPAATVRATGERVVKTAGRILAAVGTDHGLGGQPPGVDTPTRERPAGARAGWDRDATPSRGTARSWTSPAAALGTTGPGLGMDR